VSTCDATRLPKPVVEGQLRVMRGALRDAGIMPEQVNYINAHATSTVVGDAVEVEAIKQVFGDHAYRIPINATKSMLGHCLTAACLVELVALLVQMEDGYLHPSINLEEPELGFDLDFVPHVARPYVHRGRDFEFVWVRRAQRLRGRGPGPIGTCVQAYATFGETCGVLREVSKEYREPSLFFSSRIFPSAEILHPVFSIRKVNGPADNSSTSAKDAGLGGSSLVRRTPPNG
jgi:hypothetical protein